ncbi:hypothetical protein LOC68_17895 [Blastopirellula sp. JC732]|uniref:Cupin domain-containing protein n=1 Tax=Blastopirellula sediminis TaxID=2894196 RepID=A0A9X1MPD1_9BACT|nr:hypothetical protein [Blastopirellula sediminis]MCC9606431.1 hypothetical protein [Blastopirellula sediminis]MCC9630271.1 hypothetical protein [Blastopirellula sediminis]
METLINRRQSLQALGIAALGMTLLRSDQLFAGEVEMSQWLTRLYDNADRLGQDRISGLQWQEVMDQIYADVPMDSLKRRLQFDSLCTRIMDEIGSDRGELFHTINLPISGAPTDLEVRQEAHQTLITKVAHIKKGRSIPPHGHSNMASAFLCISGDFEVRQYDKLEDQPEHLVLRQTEYQTSAGPGTWSSISDYRNNVHWLTAKTDDCFLFTCKMIGIEQGRKLNGRINVDVLRAAQLGTGVMRAPKITHQEAAELY